MVLEKFGQLYGLACAWSMAADLARLLSRICSVVNPRPQTLQRQPGDWPTAVPGRVCRSGRLAWTNSLLHSGHCRWII